MPSHPWLAERTDRFDSSGIRKVFDLAAKLENPINLSIGQPDFPAPAELKAAAHRAIDEDLNGYSQTQGVGNGQRVTARCVSRRGMTSCVARCV